MKIFSRIAVISSFLLVTSLATGCSPEVGSDQWCSDLKAKPKGEWTANEAADFAKHCILK